jgi:hypothetical protein
VSSSDVLSRTAKPMELSKPCSFTQSKNEEMKIVLINFKILPYKYTSVQTHLCVLHFRRNKLPFEEPLSKAHITPELTINNCYLKFYSKKFAI